MREKTAKTNRATVRRFWKGIQPWKDRIKYLHGDPHFVAMGMAIGAFVAATPTMPFQTAIAVALAFVLRSSKVAAAVGVWLSNPITFPVFYLAGYKLGILVFGISDVNEMGGEPVNILKLGTEIAIAAVIGGIIIGLCLAAVTYFITRKIHAKVRSCENMNHNSACESRL